MHGKHCGQEETTANEASALSQKVMARSFLLTVNRTWRTALLSATHLLCEPSLRRKIRATGQQIVTNVQPSLAPSCESDLTSLLRELDTTRLSLDRSATTYPSRPSSAHPPHRGAHHRPDHSSMPTRSGFDSGPPSLRQLRSGPSRRRSLVRSGTPTHRCPASERAARKKRLFMGGFPPVFTTRFVARCSRGRTKGPHADLKPIHGTTMPPVNTMSSTQTVSSPWAMMPSLS